MANNMNYGWGITLAQAHPAVCGLEQEIVINKVADRPVHVSSRTQKPTNQPKRLSQIEDTEPRPELTGFMNLFVDSQYGTVERVRSGTGYFIADGKIYVDEGKNLEIVSTECTDPSEVAARMWSMRNTLKGFLKEYPGWAAYNDSGSIDSTVAFHENYFTLHDLMEIEHEIALDLIPTLVTRIVLTGTGGPDLAGNLSLSPRMAWMEKITSNDSRSGRGFILIRAEPHSSVGSRLQIISSDQIMSGENISLQCGITAFALRLSEIGRLPDTNIDWFDVRDQLNSHSLEGPDLLFFYAVEYQKQLLMLSKEYVNQCRELGLPEIFGSQEATDFILDIWEERLDSLELYCRDKNLETISDRCEWANKYEMLQALREKQQRIANNHLSNTERWLCMEMNALVPSSDLFALRQERFVQPLPYDLDLFTTARGHTRAEFISALREVYGEVHHIHPEMTWQEIAFKGNNCKVVLDLPTPFSGSEIDLDLMLMDVRSHAGALQRTYSACTPLEIVRQRRIGPVNKD